MSSSHGKVNPFYIEPAQKQAWEGDYWENDQHLEMEDEEEAEAFGLLSQNLGSDSPSHNHSNNKRRVFHTQEYNSRVGGTSRRERTIILGSVVGFIFLVLILASQSENNDPQGKSPDPNISNDDDDELPIKFPSKLVLLGERHSGVDYFRQGIQDCYPRLASSITTSLTRGTMWFQDDKTVFDYLDEDIQFVLVVRSPYDWMEAMRTHPLYMPNHMAEDGSNSLDWQTFVERPWAPPDSQITTPPSDETTIATSAMITTEESVVTTIPGTTSASEGGDGDSSSTTTTIIDDDDQGVNLRRRLIDNPDFDDDDATYCQLGFTDEQVVPCITDPSVELTETTPIYELDPDTREAYENIVDFREAKLNYFFQEFQPEGPWGEIFGHPLVIFHYEHSMRDAVEHLAKATTWGKDYICNHLNDKPPASESPIDPDFAAYLTQHVHWETEAKFGYKPLKAKMT